MSIPNKHILGLSGKDSLATALLIKAHEPEVYHDLTIFSCLTGADYPETLKWLKKVQELLDKKIVFLDGDIFTALENNKKQDAYFLPSIHARYCTREAKIQPLEKWLAQVVGENKVEDNNQQTILYTGIRADEERIGYKSNDKIRSEFPLHKYNFDLGKVWELIFNLPEKYQPPTFYWERLHKACREHWDVTFPKLAGRFDEHLTPIQKTILLSGRSRPNCFFCFNQRRYEVCWLWDAHPNLFAVMKSYEQGKGGYSWVPGFPLSEITAEVVASKVAKRARQIIRQVKSQIFGEDVKNDNSGFESMKSCGLFCGK